MSTMTTDDLAEGIRRKGEGQARAVSGASEWYLQAQEDLKTLAQTKQEFNADDLIAVTGLPHADGPTNSNNAVGPVFSWARRKGLIEVAGYARTKRGKGNARMITTWKGTGLA